jgi:hypothetical protein
MRRRKTKTWVAMRRVQAMRRRAVWQEAESVCFGVEAAAAPSHGRCACKTTNRNSNYMARSVNDSDDRGCAHWCSSKAVGNDSHSMA